MSSESYESDLQITSLMEDWEKSINLLMQNASSETDPEEYIVRTINDISEYIQNTLSEKGFSAVFNGKAQQFIEAGLSITFFGPLVQLGKGSNIPVDKDSSGNDIDPTREYTVGIRGILVNLYQISNGKKEWPPKCNSFDFQNNVMGFLKHFAEMRSEVDQKKNLAMQDIIPILGEHFLQQLRLSQ